MSNLAFVEKKPINRKTHKHFPDGPCGTIVPGTNPHPSPGTKRDKNGDFYCGIKQRKAGFVPGDGSHFVPGRGSHLSPGTVPVCPGHRPAEKCLCLLVFFLCQNRSESVQFFPETFFFAICLLSFCSQMQSALGRITKLIASKSLLVQDLSGQNCYKIIPWNASFLILFSLHK